MAYKNVATSDLERYRENLEKVGSERAVLPAKVMQVSSNLTINRPVKLPPGCVLDIPSGITLTIADSFDAGLYQVFKGNGTVVFNGAIDDVRVEWWYDGTNAASAIATAMREGKRAILSTDVSIDGTVVIAYREHLHLAGCAINRSGSSTDEVVRLGNSWATLTGDGYASIFNPNTNGKCVRIGSANVGDSLGIEFCSIRNIVLQGDNASGSVALEIGPTSATASVYETAIKFVQCRRVGTGLLINGSNANANDFEHMMFRDCHDWPIDIDDGGENIIRGGFAHNCANATRMIRIRNGATLNQVVGFAAEPGGSTAGGYEIDAASTRNIIISSMNCPGTSVDSGSKNITIDTFTGVSFNDQTVRADVFTGVNKSNGYHSGLTQSKGGVAGSGGTAVLDIGSGGSDMFVEVDIMVKFDGGGQRASFSYQRLVIEGSEAAGGETAIQQFHNQSTGSFNVATTDFAVTRPSAGVIRITYTNSGTGAVTVQFSVKGKGLDSLTIT